MAEASLQTKVLKYMNSLPQCIAENVSGTAAQSGRADINACYKGRCLKIELKDPGTGYKPTQQQILYLKRWAAAGAKTGVCYSLKEVKVLLEEIDEIQGRNEHKTKD